MLNRTKGKKTFQNETKMLEMLDFDKKRFELEMKYTYNNTMHLEENREREREILHEKSKMRKFWTYFDDIRPPTRCNWWNGRTSCRAGGRCGHNCCGWIMSWWEILMMEHVLSVVKFQTRYRISVRIHWLHFEKRVHLEIGQIRVIFVCSILISYSLFGCFFILSSLCQN